ncbi:DUF177 domain-containing protein [Balneolales bacterium ANBcel1]|nr:DUF177 domain-containing protein [Balneolales bacterium ANBcel1]
MISFRLNEIPKGISQEHMTVSAEELDIDLSEIRTINLALRFHKRDEHLRIECEITAEAEFVCDRSLDTFSTELKSTYEVVFQTDAQDEREDLSGAFRRLDPAQNVVDITRELRDSLLLSVPAKKLHPRYYRDGEVTDFKVRFGEEDKEHDPRWDKLKKLKQNIPKN